MEEMEVQDRPGLFGKIAGIFSRERAEDEEFEAPEAPNSSVGFRQLSVYRVTLRRQIVALEDAYEAAQGLRRGDQQIMNLTATEPALREKIKDFMAGVTFAQDAIWEEIGDHIYMIAPNCASVEVAPASPRMTAIRN